MIAAVVLAATLSIQDYVTMPTVATPRWSPDGKRIVYIVTLANFERSSYESDVWIAQADGSGNRQLTSAKGSETRPRWSPDGTRIAYLAEKDGKTGIWISPAEGGEPRQLVDPPASIREFEWSPNGRFIAYAGLDGPTPEEAQRAKEKDDARVVGENRRQVHLHLVDAASGETRRLTGGAYTVWSLGWSPDGKTIAFSRGPGNTLDDLYRADLYTVDVESGVIHALLVRPGLENNPDYSPDGKWISFTSQGGVHGWLLEHHIYVMPAAGGPAIDVSKSYARTPDSVAWTRDSRALYVEAPRNTTTQIFRVNIDGSDWKAVTNVDGALDAPNYHGDRAAFIYQSLTEPPEVHVANVAARRITLKRVSNHNAEMRTRTLAETRLIRWKNPKDGWEIEGLLTLPAGYRGGRVPLVTFVHGGPASRFVQTFLGYLGTTYAPQVLAANGIAVLCPNPRGTGGYGETFRAGNLNDWGGMDWIDVNAGIDKVIADGIADPDRLGMCGWSYGGFLSAWAIGHSDRLKAISAGAPVTDLVSYHGTADIRDFIPHYFEQRETPPDPALDEMRHAPLSFDLLRAHSPLWHLKKTNAKVMIQHGEVDERVPVSQGMMLYRMLDELGVDVKMILYPRSGHAIREPKLRMDVARRNVEFFTTNLACHPEPR